MEILLLAMNSAILSLLYQKQLEQSSDLATLKSRISTIEGVIIERRKPIRIDCNLSDSDL